MERMSPMSSSGGEVERFAINANVVRLMQIVRKTDRDELSGCLRQY